MAQARAQRVDEGSTAGRGWTFGVDVGVKTLAMCWGGIAYPKPLKRSLGRLARLQRRKARGRKGSKRNRLLKERKVHKRIRDMRADAQATTAIVKRSGRVVRETLNVKGMTRNRGAFGGGFWNVRVRADARVQVRVAWRRVRESGQVVSEFAAMFSLRRTESRLDARNARVALRVLRRGAWPRLERGDKLGR